MSDELEGNLELDLGDAPKAEVKKAPPRRTGNKPAPVKAAVGLPETTRIMLEESDDIPPGGLGIGHNGRTYLLRAGEEADVPNHVIGVLDDAVMAAPVLQPGTKRVIGYRDRLRYPYRVIR